MFFEKPHFDLDNSLEAEEISKEEKDLSEFCLQSGNPIVFLKTKSQNNYSAKLDHDWDIMDEDEKALAEMILQQASSFLSSPAFTDSFHQDHEARRIWEGNSLKKDSFSELADLYASNRFNLNLLGMPLLFLSWVESLKEKYSLSLEQKNIIKKIETDLDDIGKDKFSKYGEMNDKQKFEIITKLEVVFQSIVNLLSGK